MTNQVARAYIDALITNYVCGTKSSQNDGYRLVWMSENDIKALKMASEKLKEAADDKSEEE